MTAVDVDFRPARPGASALWRRLADTDFGAVLRGTAQVLAIRVAGAALAYASMVFLARVLGTFEFGIYAYIWACVLIGGAVLPLGYSAAALRFLPDYLARAKWSRLIGFLRESYAISVALALAASAVAAALVFALRGFVPDYYFAPLLLGLLALPLAVLLGNMENTARAFGLVQLAFVPTYIVRPFLVVAAVGGLAALGFKATAESVLWVLIAASLAAIVVQAIPILRWIKKTVPAIKATHHTRHWATVSLSFGFIEGFRLVMENADIVIVGQLVDPHQVGIYFAAIRTASLIAFLYFAVSAMAVPKITEIGSVGSKDDLQRFVTGVIHLMFWPSLAAALIMAAFGHTALSLFGTVFDDAYPVLLVSLAGLVMRAATGPVDYLLILTGHHKDAVRAYGAGALANIVLNVMLIPRFGIVGAAIATYLAFGGANIWMYVMAKKRLGIRSSIFAGLTVRL